MSFFRIVLTLTFVGSGAGFVVNAFAGPEALAVANAIVFGSSVVGLSVLEARRQSS